MSITDIFLKGNDRSLIENLLKDGAERRKGEEELFKSYSYFIAEATRKYSISEDEAFDAYSDSVLIALEKIRNHSFEGRSSIKTWLFQIFHNKCVDLLRKKTTNKYSVHQTHSISDVLYQLSDETKLVIDELAGKTDMDFGKRKFDYKTKGMMAEIGKRTGVAILFGKIKLHGFSAWWLWRSYYLLNLPSYRKKLKVMGDWTFDLIFKPDVSQIN